MALKFIKKTVPEAVEEPVKVEVNFQALMPVVDEIGDLATKLTKLQDTIAEKSKPLREQMDALVAKEVAKVNELSAKKFALETKLTADVQSLDEAEIGTDVNEILSIPGHKFVAEYDKKGNLRVITDIKALADILGEDTFWAKAKVDLKTVDDYCTPEEKEVVLTNTKTPRKLKQVRKI